MFCERRLEGNEKRRATERVSQPLDSSPEKKRRRERRRKERRRERRREASGKKRERGEEEVRTSRARVQEREREREKERRRRQENRKRERQRSRLSSSLARRPTHPIFCYVSLGFGLSHRSRRRSRSTIVCNETAREVNTS